MNEDDRQLVAGFEACTLDPANFGHTVHVRLAWALLQDLPVEQALGRFVEGLRRFVTHHGCADKFHATVTGAYVFLIAERSQALSTGHRWSEFADANADLLGPYRQVLARWYSDQRLDSEAARVSFILPDASRPPVQASGSKRSLTAESI